MLQLYAATIRKNRNGFGNMIAARKPPLYNFCPLCSNRLGNKKIGNESYQACIDSKCGWIYWGHTPTTVCVICLKPGDASQVLLVERLNEPFSGTWCLPAGFVEYGEMPASAAHRELAEETGLNAGRLEFVGHYLEDSHPKTFSVLNAFVASNFKGKPTHGDDAKSLRYWPIAHLPEIGFTKHIKVLQDYLQI